MNTQLVPKFSIMEPGPVTKRPMIRPASFDDYDQIAALENRNALGTKPGEANFTSMEAREQWLHLWQSNPAYQQLPDWPIGWVLENGAGRIVGSLLNVPCLYRFAGRTYVAAFGRGWAVDVEYRALSTLLIARQFKQPKVDLRLTSTAGPRTSTVLTMQGWSRVPSGRWDCSAIWVTNYAQTVRRYLTARTPSLVAASVSPLLYAPLSVKDAISARPRRSKTRYELGWSTGFDGRFDQFWAELEIQKPHVLLASRDCQTLRWHFKYALEQNRTWILTVSEGPRLIAYAILERRHAQSFDLTRMLFVDYQTLAADENPAPAMISFVLDRCRKEGIHLLENIGCWLEKEQALKPRAPYHRRMGNWSYLYRATNPELVDALKSAESWCPTHYDTDATL